MLNPLYRGANRAFFTLANPVLDSHTWYVAYNEPFHITKWLYDFLKTAKYVDRSERVRRGADGKTHTKTVNTPMSAYVIEDLPPLTEKELAELAKEQLATGRLENND